MVIDWGRGSVATIAGQQPVYVWANHVMAAGALGARKDAYMPQMSYDMEEAERQEAQRLAEEAAIVAQIEAMLGPSQDLIKDTWTIALMQLDEQPTQTIEIQYDIDDASLQQLVNRNLSVGVTSGEATGTGSIVAPDSTVTFVKQADGWMYFRTEGTA